MAKYILKARPLSKFRGSIRTKTGVDKRGNDIYSAAKYYWFDKFGRLEANDETIKDLDFAIKIGKIRIVNLNEVVDKVDIQDMTKAELIAELELLKVEKIEGKALNQHNKQTLIDYLEEIYLQKSQAKKG